MPNVERFGTFYGVWPVIDGKPINYQWGEVRSNTAESKAIVRNSFQELQDGQEELNALRALLGQAFGDLTFSNRYRFYYNKSTLKFCLQKNDGTVETPVWTDVWCVNLSDGQLQVESQGGVSSAAGFYGPGLENIYQIGETGSEANESFTHRSKLFFNTDDGFELDEITSGGNAGGVEVRYVAPFGKAEEFIKVGKEWVIDHNFGITPVLVQVMNEDKQIVIPDLADVSDPNTAYFYFHEVTSGSVYIASGGVGATSLVPRDPFYLVIRHDGQSSDLHRLYPNADLVFDSAHFYVDVDLTDKRAFVSLVGPGGGFITNVEGSRNIAVESNAGTSTINLQPKLSGMEAFYFWNGDAITADDSIHFEIEGIDRMVIGKDGVRVTDKVEAEAFYIDGGGRIYNVPGQEVAIVGGTSKSVSIYGPQSVGLFAPDALGTIDISASTGIVIDSQSNSTLVGTNQVSIASDNEIELEVRGTRMNLRRKGTHFTKQIEAGGFYLEPGANNVGFDLSEATLEIHIPTPAEQPYFLVNFSPQDFIVEDVALCCQSGTAIFGFYILLENEIYRNGIGIVGSGKDGNTLAQFYVVPALRKVMATSNNVVRKDQTLVMTCNNTSSARNVRGRVRVRLSG